MQTGKIKHNWVIAGAVAAMLAASTAGVRAQDTTPPTTSTPPGTSATSGSTGAGPVATGTMDNSTTTSGNMSSGSLSGSMSSGSMSGGSMNASVLNNRVYDYIDLQQAKARGLSESQIATTAKIAKETGIPFRVVSAAVERGETFPMIAAQNNLKLGDVYENDKEKQEIADYMASYDYATSLIGTGGMPMTGDMNGMSGSTGTMPSSSAPAPASADMSSSTATMDIVDTAMSAKNLTTLVKALQVAGLVETLKGAGPFTVFAPTDQAFSRLPAGQLDALLADPAKLKTILTYHVIPASIMAADASAMTSPTSPPTVEGGTLQVTKARRGRLRINDATVTKADIKASNGVIHIIDRVLMPSDASAATGTTDMTAPAAPTPPAPDGTTPPPAPAQ